jgi:hypothetical protein
MGIDLLSALFLPLRNRGGGIEVLSRFLATTYVFAEGVGELGLSEFRVLSTPIRENPRKSVLPGFPT